MLAELTAQPEYLDQDIIDKCTQVVYRLTELDDGIFYLILEQNVGNLRMNYFLTLEHINKFARLNSIEWTL